MTDRIIEGGLQVASVLHNLVEKEIIPGTGIEPKAQKYLCVCISSLPR